MCHLDAAGLSPQVLRLNCKSRHTLSRYKVPCTYVSLERLAYVGEKTVRSIAVRKPTKIISYSRDIYQTPRVPVPTAKYEFNDFALFLVYLGQTNFI